jgi:hypothetical protein
VPDGETLADPVGLAIESKSARRVGHSHVVEGMRVLRLRDIKRVGGFVAEADRPRRTGRPLTEPFETEVGDDICLIAWHGLASLAVDVRLRVEVLSLTLVGDESVEAGAGSSLSSPMCHLPI